MAQLLPTRVLRGAKVRIGIGPGVAMETVDLDPAKVFTRSIPNAQPGHYRFELADAAGKTLLAYTEEEMSATAADAVKWGEVARQLTPVIGEAAMKRTIKQNHEAHNVTDLIRARAVDDFVAFCRRTNPIMSAEESIARRKRRMSSSARFLSVMSRPMPR